MNQVIKKHIILTVLVMCSAFFLIAFLTWSAVKPKFEKHGFDRKVDLNSLEIVDVLHKDEEVVDIAGIDNNGYYFKTFTPGKIFTTDNNLNNGKYIYTKIPFDKRLEGFFHCIVDYPAIKILAGNVPAIIVGNQNDSASLFRFPGSLFTRVVSIGDHSYVFRGLDKTIKSADQIFFKGNPFTGEVVREKNVSQMRNDAGIADDGYLNFDATTSLLTYVFFNKSKFIVLDTNLNLINSFHTVDTLKNIKTDIGIVSAGASGMILTNKAPNESVNSMSQTSKGLLFNISDLKSDNETNDGFGRNSVIDVYGIKNGLYKTSFYVPKYKYEKLISFRITNDYHLLGLYKDYMVKFKINKQVFQ
jgi:hypothetical protein